MKATSTVVVDRPAVTDQAFVDDLTAEMARRCASLAGMRPGQAIKTEAYWREDGDLPAGAQLLIVTVTFPDYADPGTHRRNG